MSRALQPACNMLTVEKPAAVSAAVLCEVTASPASVAAPGMTIVCAAPIAFHAAPLSEYDALKLLPDCASFTQTGVETLGIATLEAAAPAVARHSKSNPFCAVSNAPANIAPALRSLRIIT